MRTRAERRHLSARSLGIAMLLTGCGATAVRVAPENVQQAEALPAGYVAIGRVVASCSSVGGFRATDGEPLASFDTRCAWRRAGSARAISST